MSYMWGITTERPTRAEARRRREAAKAEGATYVEANVVRPAVSRTVRLQATRESMEKP